MIDRIITIADYPDLTPQAAVARGAALLDEHDPGWWHEGRINLDTLDLSSTCLCVLGQLRESYGAALDELGLLTRDVDLTHMNAIEHGFDAPFDPADWLHLTASAGRSQFAGLDQAWRELIKARREDDTRE